MLSFLIIFKFLREFSKARSKIALQRSLQNPDEYTWSSMYCYARSIKWSIFRYFWLHLPKKMYDVPKSHVGFLKARSQENLTPPPTAHICSDRSFVALSNVISHYVQSSLLMAFSGLENTAIKRVSRELPSSDGSKKILNISILIALLMRNPNLSSEFL